MNSTQNTTQNTTQNDTYEDFIGRMLAVRAQFAELPSQEEICERAEKLKLAQARFVQDMAAMKVREKEITDEAKEIQRLLGLLRKAGETSQAILDPPLTS